MGQPVFYDPRRARWKRIRLAFDVIGVSITLLVVFFAYTALRNEPLPELLLAPQKRPYRALKEKERDTAKERRRLAYLRRSQRKSRSAPSQVKLNQEEGMRAAYYVPYDAASFSSLREYARQIDLLFPDWLHVITPDGRLQSVDEQTNRFFDVMQDSTVRSVDEKVMPFLKAEDTGMEVFPMVNNFDGRDWVNVSAFLNNQEARSHFRQQVASFLATDRYRGLMIDFETLPRSGQAGYLALLKELSNDLRSKGMKLYVSMQARNQEYDYAAVASRVDGVVLMNYDEHYPSPGTAGPVASQDWFLANLQAATKVIPKDKLISAIGNYGYDWVKKPKRGPLPPGVKDINVTVQDAWLTARDSEADVDFDGDSLNPHISYLDEHDLQHDIWFLDAVTALNQMRAAQSLGIQTFALWRLGSEDRSLWRVWDIPGEVGAENKLKDVPPGQDVDMEGSGEILRIEARPADGQRSVTLDQTTGIITDQSFDSLPEPYRVARYGSSPDKVAITFDDGPDPEWTPKILDVLKREHVPASFFLIGIQADKFSDVTDRIYREGHEIGNHTFTHPDISNISKGFMRAVELNLTEQLFASRLGIRTILFRPPYSIDAEPDTEDQVRPLEITQDMGYITIGDKIDPNDWRDNPRHSADQIAADVLAHLPPCAAGDIHCGNIILLHDGGGDREQTVLALPEIIAGVRAKGLQIVPLYDLLGRTRAEVMPPIPSNQRWVARLNLFGFALFPLAFNAMTWIFFVGDVLMTGRLLFIGAFAIFDRLWPRRYGTPGDASNYLPPVAVLIPAYNEEKVIARTIRSALVSTYPNLHVIVIDDGSSDKTLEVARKAFALEEASGRVLILTKPNSGKADALNFGLEHLHGEEIFVGIDADTVIASDAISRLIPHFLNPKVGAVAGNAKVGNRINLWTRWQALEYITSQNFERRALNTMGAVSVVPGAIGAWRVSAVQEASGFHTDTVAEDADLTMALLQRGYRVEYEDLALAYTEAPVNARGLMRQRFRWSFGILQSVWKHRAAFARDGVLGWIALPNIAIFQVLLPLVSPFIDIMFFVGTVWYFVQKFFHPESTDPGSFQRLIVFFVAFLVMDFLASAIAFALERRRPEAPEDPWLLSQVWLQRFAYRQLFSLVLLKTLKRAAEGRRFAWDKLERTAAMSYQPMEQGESVKVP
jgi:cellulose synthase/poly-beta-1,6-N-acetylglucosamine synthase-like glycosyltransferase/peptidoglycan/xylan/chitin deacetylase (PgdA/CDA1 family)/spore germination protein YaaH